MPWGDFSYKNIHVFVGVLKFEMYVVKTPKGLYLSLSLIMEKPSILVTGKSYLPGIPCTLKSY